MPTQSAEEKAISKKQSQADWYERNQKRERERARVRAAARRCRIKSSQQDKGISSPETAIKHSSRVGQCQRSKERECHLADARAAAGKYSNKSHNDTPVQRHKNLPPCPQYDIRTFASLAADTESEDDIPIASYDDDDDENDSDHNLLPVFSSPSSQPLRDIRSPSPIEPSHHSLLNSPEITPTSRQRSAKNALDCIVTVATLVGQWNTEWGPVSNWAQKFTDEYLAAIDEKRIVAFANGILQKIRSGRMLMEDITCVITECTLPTTEANLKSFMQLMKKLVAKLTSGTTILEDRLQAVKNLLDASQRR